jgi:hypothetical protein
MSRGHAGAERFCESTNFDERQSRSFRTQAGSLGHG